MKVGILGGGQLGRMLALEGYPLGITPVFLEPEEDPSVAGIGDVVRAAFDDTAAIRKMAAEVDVVTYEFEKVPVGSARALQEAGVVIHPAPAALEMAQDRLAEKRSFQELSIPIADFRPVDDRASLNSAVEELGFPALLKTRFGGYDGKGQFALLGPDDVDAAWDSLGGEPLILEAFVKFERELSVLAVRGKGSGGGAGPDRRSAGGDRGTRGEVNCEMAFYPLVQNEHEGGILQTSIAPAPDVSPEMRARAKTYARRVLEHLDYVGVVAIELFQVGDALLVNEMAPRVHNSGHWTLDGAHHSQFENHLRAICGLPLGSAECRGHSGMVNILGRLPEDPAALLRIPGTHLHLYGKSAQPLRKIGHVNVTGEDPGEVRERMEAVRRVINSES